MSIPERVLWKALRDNRLGVKFRRQHPLGPYSLDFYCHAARLVVELDGRCHDDRQEHDRARDAWLRGQGLLVHRISVSNFSRDTAAAIRGIENLVATRCAELRLPPPPGEVPSLRGGEGSVSTPSTQPRVSKVRS